MAGSKCLFDGKGRLVTAGIQLLTRRDGERERGQFGVWRAQIRVGSGPGGTKMVSGTKWLEAEPALVLYAAGVRCLHIKALSLPNYVSTP